MFLKIIENNIQKIFGRWMSSVAINSISLLDKLQSKALEEKCYLVDDDDKIIGNASKKECHLVQKDGTIPLHRAFSVFLFNSQGDLLLQKRSSVKITYPNYYTNTCCSHPLQDIEGEDDENNAIGIKRAAQRRLNYELGIPKHEIPLDKLNYMTRIHYFDSGNGIFGEHEIDYILIFIGDVTLKPNPNEVNEISFIPRKHMNTFHKDFDSPFTPWFNFILKHRLIDWWKNLENIQQFIDHKTIHKFI